MSVHSFCGNWKESSRTLKSTCIPDPCQILMSVHPSVCPADCKDWDVRFKFVNYSKHDDHEIRHRCARPHDSINSFQEQKNWFSLFVAHNLKESKTEMAIKISTRDPKKVDLVHLISWSIDISLIFWFFFFLPLDKYTKEQCFKIIQTSFKLSILTKH